MPRRTGTVKWSDLIAKALSELGGEGSLKQIYEKLFSFDESKEKMMESASRTKDFQHQTRAVIRTDDRFVKCETRGVWRLRISHEAKQYTMPARYTERSQKLLILMRNNPIKTGDGWSQRELAKALQVDINAVNRLVNFMIIEDILFLKGGEGKSYKPFVYAPRPDVWKNLRIGGMDWEQPQPKPDGDAL